MDTPSPLPRIFLQAGGDRRVALGHPWAYSNEIRMDAATKALPAGTLATLHRTDGKPLGVGTFTPHALIAFRVLSRDAHTSIDRAFLARRLERALALRNRCFDAPFYRLVHAESDELPGIVIDRFGDAVVVQINTAGAEALRDDLLGAVDDVLAPATVVLRNDSRGREGEGLASVVEVVRGSADSPVMVEEGGRRFLADLVGGQKTGWYFDQRDNRLFTAPFAAGAAMLDVFCHTGGFAVAAATGGASRVVGIDSSQAALDLAGRAAHANAVDALCTFRKADAFDALEGLASGRERFGLVVCDPPAFVKSRKDLATGLKGYRKLARLAATVVAPGGFLFIASCSHNVDGPALVGEIARGLAAAGRSGSILRQAGAGPDHPVHPHLPETGYLKAVLLALD